MTNNDGSEAAADQFRTFFSDVLGDGATHRTARRMGWVSGASENADPSGPQPTEEPVPPPQRAVDPSQGRGSGDAIRMTPSDEFANQMKDILGPTGTRRRRYHY